MYGATTTQPYTVLTVTESCIAHVFPAEVSPLLILTFKHVSHSLYTLYYDDNDDDDDDDDDDYEDVDYDDDDDDDDDDYEDVDYDDYDAYDDADYADDVKVIYVLTNVF